MNRHLLCLAALAAPPTFAQEGIAISTGTPAQPGPLVVLDESRAAVHPAPSKLDAVSFLPFEVTGRTWIATLEPGAVRIFRDLPGATRAVLPGVGGNLYHHWRVLPSGVLRFGYLHASRQGKIRILLERSGTGAQGLDDPFLGDIAVARDGRCLLVATTVAAGGDLIDVDLIGLRVRVRTAAVPPLIIDAGSLTLANGYGALVTDRGLLRFDDADDAQVGPVALGDTSPDYFGGEIVRSANGLFLATAAGDSAEATHLWVIDATGPARRATRVPGEIASAGFLPEYPHGPFIAVSDDGGSCVWRQEIVTPMTNPVEKTGELFLREVDAPQQVIERHLTGDSEFVDTLDEVGVLTSFNPGSTVIALGEPGDGPGPGMESAEFFRVEIDLNGDLQVTNLSQTSGVGGRPFPAGTLELDLVHRLPGTNHLLVYDGDFNDSERVVAVSTDQPGLTTLFGNTRELDFAISVDDWIVVAVERDTVNRERELVRIPTDLSAPATILESQADRLFDYPAQRQDGWLCWITRLNTGMELVQRVDLATGVVEDFPLGLGQYGAVLGLTPSGAAVFSRELGAGGVRFVVWPFESQSWTELPLMPTSGHVVPGR